MVHPLPQFDVVPESAGQHSRRRVLDSLRLAPGGLADERLLSDLLLLGLEAVIDCCWLLFFQSLLDGLAELPLFEQLVELFESGAFLRSWGR